MPSFNGNFANNRNNFAHFTLSVDFVPFTYKLSK